MCPFSDGFPIVGGIPLQEVSLSLEGVHLKGYLFLENVPFKRCPVTLYKRCSFSFLLSFSSKVSFENERDMSMAMSIYDTLIGRFTSHLKTTSDMFTHRAKEMMTSQKPHLHSQDFQSMFEVFQHHLH